MRAPYRKADRLDGTPSNFQQALAWVAKLCWGNPGLTLVGFKCNRADNEEAQIVDYCQLNRTELRVSRICFGTMTFGQPVDQLGATRMLDRCIEVGINFVDTANVYKHGQAESMLGTAMRGKRDKLVVASKVRQKMGDGPDDDGLSKRAIFRAVEDSLRRL